ASVLVFLGIPLIAGFLTRTIGERAKGREWYEDRFLPRVGPWALYGLLFTIVLLFALQGGEITSNPLNVARIALPLLVYFVVVFAIGMITGRVLSLGYEKTTTLAFTAAGNNFELAIAVAIGTFGVASGQALAGVVGPLIEVPILVALVYVALSSRPRPFPTQPTTTARESPHGPPPVRCPRRVPPPVSPWVSPSAPVASPRGRRWPVALARSSKSRPSWRSSTCPSGPDPGCSRLNPRPRTWRLIMPDTTATTDLPVAVIGAGPTGLAAAAHLVTRGIDPIVFEAGPTPAAAVLEWGHIGLFSPWKYNIDQAARTLLESVDWQEP